MEIQTPLITITGYLWGWPMLVALLAVGIGYTFYLKGIQFVLLARAIRITLRPKKHDADSDGDISQFQALMTGLSATVGTGNIAGVATAIAAGGPGAVVWMWATGILGMATKYAEAVLGVHYRKTEADGTQNGGPMHYLYYGVKRARWLGYVYAFCLLLAAPIVAGMVQSNSIGDILHTNYGITPWHTGITLTIICGLVIIGGITRIGDFASKVVPTMVLIYLVTGLFILAFNIVHIPSMFEQIFTSAFSGTAAVGGFLGAAVKEVLRYGLSRGVFSNESGIGSGAIAAATAKTKHPVDQALVAMLQTLIDTLIVCTTTALIIVMSMQWTVGPDLNGPSLTAAAFNVGLGHLQFWGQSIGSFIVALCLFFFVLTTIVGWGGVYGVQAARFAFGSGRWVVIPYKLILLLCIFAGTLVQLELVWLLADVIVGAMIIPNLIGLVIMAPLVKRLTIDYMRNERDGLGYQVRPFFHKNK